MTNLSLLRATFTFLVASTLGATTANAQSYPTKPVRFVLMGSPGAPEDFVMRLLAEPLGKSLKQPMVIENKPGVGGNLAVADVASSAPDGYTFYVGPDTVFSVNPLVYRKSSVNALDSMVPVTYLSSLVGVLACNSATGIRTVADLRDAARQRSLSYASGGAGTPGHLMMELLFSMQGFSMLHIPYR